MKIHILYNFKDGPTGGGNQFLKALRASWQKQNVYEESAQKADVILFNSHHELKKVFKLKKKFPEKVFIHRIDGPIQLYRGKDKSLDQLIFKANSLLADGTVWQSNWSREENRKLYSRFAQYEAVIFNASDPLIFNKIGKKSFNPKERIKIVAVSWSDNPKKGFALYKYLDDNLDFKKFQMVFVGNLPGKLKNIKWKKPVPSKEVADILKQSDIYITASQKDPCSNSLIEALSCGLTAVVLNDGGHPELVQKGGELFGGQEDIIAKIEKVAGNYLFYQSHLPEFSIQKASKQYFDFARKIFEDAKNGYYFPRQIGVLAIFSFKASIFLVFWSRIIKNLNKGYAQHDFAKSYDKK